MSIWNGWRTTVLSKRNRGNSAIVRNLVETAVEKAILQCVVDWVNGFLQENEWW